MRKEYLPFGKPSFDDEEISAVTSVIRSGWIGMGQETQLFEQELAAYIGAKHVIAVNSCTSALFLSLISEGIGEGDEVIVPSFTWCSTANAVLYANATPVFCDINEKTLSASIDSILEIVTDKTRAVIIVHYAGLVYDVEGLRNALPEKIKIIEDAAHAIGAEYLNNSKTGSSGNLTCFSFYANKNISTAEGGAIALNDDKKAERIISLRLHGLSSDAWKRFTNPKVKIFDSEINELGYKMNYTDLQAAIGRVQLRKIGRFSKIRSEIADCYLKMLDDSKISYQQDINDSRHARHLFPVIVDENIDRDKLFMELRSLNIGVSIHYAPLHKMPLYKNTQSLPVTESVAKKIMTLPISASMSRQDALDVIEAFNYAIRKL